jgi:hypothetical protein
LRIRAVLRTIRSMSIPQFPSPKLSIARHCLTFAIIGFFVICPRSHAGQLSVEISPGHPLYVFDVTALEVPDPADHASNVIGAWSGLADELKPYSVVIFDVNSGDPATRLERMKTALQRFQEAGVPIALRIARSNVDLYPIAAVSGLLQDFTCVRVIYIEGLSFSEYFPEGLLAALPNVPIIDWLGAAIDQAKNYNRLCCISLSAMEWVRVSSNAWCSPLYDKIAGAKSNVAPIAATRGVDTIANMSATFGLWLEGAVDQWGVGATSQWFDDACFVAPGVFGQDGGSEKMDPNLYRAMIWNGAITGATVYVFSPSRDLWFGESKRHWLQAIYPALVEIKERGLISPKNAVQKKTRAAYQVAASKTPQDFHLVMRDLDGTRDQGLLMKGTYGMERPGQVAELIPNTGRYYWVPILSTYATQETLGNFSQVFKPASINSVAEWTAALDPHYPPDGEGSAFISRIGRAIFIMHTRENLFEEQNYRILEAPAPVRNFEVSRGDDGVVISWTRREGDFEFKVYRRIAPDSHYTLIAKELDGAKYVDTEPKANDTAGYAVTAITSDVEPCEGTVNFGDYIALSTVESRIVEEATINALLGYAKSQPLPPPEDNRPKQQTWWPNIDTLAEDQKPSALEIAARIEQFEAAFVAEKLPDVMDIYADDYTDPQEWKKDYVRRAFQWVFERYKASNMSRQIRDWDFSTFKDSGEVKVSLFCRFNAWAISDTDGRVADLPCFFPVANDGVISVTFAKQANVWRILRTDPALPNFKEILWYSTGPFDGIVPGPDTFEPR